MNPVILLLLHSQREVLAFSARLSKPTTKGFTGCSRRDSAVQRRKNGVSCSAAAHLPSCDATTGALYECAEAAAFQAQAAALRQEAAALEDALIAERRAHEPVKSVAVPIATTPTPESSQSSNTMTSAGDRKGAPPRKLTRCSLTCSHASRYSFGISGCTITCSLLAAILPNGLSFLDSLSDEVFNVPLSTPLTPPVPKSNGVGG